MSEREKQDKEQTPELMCVGVKLISFLRSRLLARWIL